MPIYEFICNSCQEEFEELVFGDDIPPCPHCQEKNCQKLISRACVHHSGGKESYAAPTASSSSKCAGCSGKSCATCH